MDVINLSIKSIRLPNGKNIESTSYQIATTGQFNTDDIVVDDANDKDNIYSKDFELDFSTTDVYYARMKLNFTDGSYYGWTKPIILTKDGDGFSHNNTVIVTPKVNITSSVNNCDLGSFKIQGSDFVIFTGVGFHSKTTWRIKNGNGNIIWESVRDTNNLREIRVPGNTLKPNRIYIIEVTYISNNNMVSNAGKLIIKTSGDSPVAEELLYGGKRYGSEAYKELEEAYDELLEFVISELAISN